jgi:hypothetical protein
VKTHPISHGRILLLLRSKGLFATESEYTTDTYFGYLELSLQSPPFFAGVMCMFTAVIHGSDKRYVLFCGLAFDFHIFSHHLCAPSYLLLTDFLCTPLDFRALLIMGMGVVATLSALALYPSPGTFSALLGEGDSDGGNGSNCIAMHSSALNEEGEPIALLDQMSCRPNKWELYLSSIGALKGIFVSSLAVLTFGPAPNRSIAYWAVTLLVATLASIVLVSVSIPASTVPTFLAAFSALISKSFALNVVFCSFALFAHAIHAVFLSGNVANTAWRILLAVVTVGNGLLLKGEHLIPAFAVILGGLFSNFGPAIFAVPSRLITRPFPLYGVHNGFAPLALLQYVLVAAAVIAGVWDEQSRESTNASSFLHHFLTGCFVAGSLSKYLVAIVDLWEPNGSVGYGRTWLDITSFFVVISSALLCVTTEHIVVAIQHIFGAPATTSPSLEWAVMSNICICLHLSCMLHDLKSSSPTLFMSWASLYSVKQDNASAYQRGPYGPRGDCRHIAITFSNSLTDQTDELLSVLKEAGDTKATFFVKGGAQVPTARLNLITAHVREQESKMLTIHISVLISKRML